MEMTAPPISQEDESHRPVQGSRAWGANAERFQLKPGRPGEAECAAGSQSRPFRAGETEWVSWGWEAAGLCG